MAKKFGTIFFLFTVLSLSVYGEEETPRIKYIPGSSAQIRTVGRALNYIGTPYLLGGTDSQGLDCSGLVYVSFRDFTELFPVPRGTEDLYSIGTIPEGPLMPGDLVFFDLSGGNPHVGIFLEDSFFIHSASEGPGTGVIVSSLKDPHYGNRYIGKRRILEWSMPIFEIFPGKTASATTHTRKLYPGAQLGFRIVSPREDRYSWTLSLLWNNELHIKKRITIQPKETGFFWYYTLPGKWTAELKDGENNLVVSLTYFVEEAEDYN